MNDNLFNSAMAVFAVVMLLVWISRPIHTGLLGSLGCVVMAATAGMAMDDSLFRDIENIQWTLVGFALGALLCVAHLVVMIVRSKVRRGVPINVPHRRDADLDTFDEAPHTREDKHRIAA